MRNACIIKHIFVVDDEADIVSLIERGLVKNGFKVDVFTDPVEALSHFKPDLYDLVLLDIKMPKMNGFELYREIRKIDSKVKVCFVTAFEVYYKEFKKVFPSLEINCVIKKPFTIQELTQQVNLAVNNIA